MEHQNARCKISISIAQYASCFLSFLDKQHASELVVKGSELRAISENLTSPQPSHLSTAQKNARGRNLNSFHSSILLSHCFLSSLSKVEVRYFRGGLGFAVHVMFLSSYSRKKDPSKVRNTTITIEHQSSPIQSRHHEVRWVHGVNLALVVLGSIVLAILGSMFGPSKMKAELVLFFISIC